MADYRTDFQKMCDQWDKACQDGVFKNAKKPPVPAPDQYAAPSATSPAENSFGMSPQMAAIAANSENINDADYWSAIFKLSRGEQVENIPRGGRLDPNPNQTAEMIQEGTWPAKGPNPVTLYSQGKDSKYQKSYWFDVEDLGKLNRMKEDLHALGDKLATQDGKVQVPSKKSESIMKQIKNLQREIDTLSNTLTLPKEEKRS
jgi:hypothetical protein